MMQRWSTGKVGYSMNNDNSILATVTNLFSIPTEPTSPKEAEAEADICANEQGKPTTYQGESLALVTLTRHFNLQRWMLN